ncbi:putative carbonyl reductase [Fischerella sp. NIES-4106]|jgi:NAD(P)-dependent dehydrogenase (short-subunit alcohol dehydrogenase family)|nr:putative carbonyl reductase [Fischerella sp. NIES-4106]
MNTDNIHDLTIALVTGANKGLGFEISRQLAQKGILVLLAARDPQKGTEAADKLQSEGLDVEFIKLDVSNSASITTADQQIRDRFGKLDILAKATSRKSSS